MRYLKNISSVALFTTLIMSSIPFSYAMEKDDETRGRQLKKLSFNAIKVEPTSDLEKVLLFVKETEKDDFRKLASAEAKQVVEELIQAYGILSEDEKTKLPFIRIVERQNGAVVFKEQLDDQLNDTKRLFRYLTTEEINNNLQLMLSTYTNTFMEEEETRKQEALKKRLETERLEAERKEAERKEAERKEAQRIEAERLEAEKAEAVEREKEKARLQAALLAQTNEEDKQRQVQEIAALKAKLEIQEATAEQEKLKREQEILKLQQQAAAQAAALKKQQQEAEAKAKAEAEAKTKTKKEGTYQIEEKLTEIVGKPLTKAITGGRNDRQIQHNVLHTVGIKDKKSKKHKPKK